MRISFPEQEKKMNSSSSRKGLWKLYRKFFFKFIVFIASFVCFLCGFCLYYGLPFLKEKNMGEKFAHNIDVFRKQYPFLQKDQEEEKVSTIGLLEGLLATNGALNGKQNKFFYSVVERLSDEISLHKEYAINSLLIESGDLQEALKNAQSLQGKIDSIEFPYLYLFNLLRLISLEGKIGSMDKSKDLKEEFIYFIQKEGPKIANFSCFYDHFPCTDEKILQRFFMKLQTMDQ